MAGSARAHFPRGWSKLRSFDLIAPDIDEVDAQIAREFEESEIFPPEDYKP